MRENAVDTRSKGTLAGLGGKAVAVGVLVIAAYVLFKIVIGVVTAVAVTIAAVLAVIAVIWALSRLL
jgi:hypothetical protein